MRILIAMLILLTVIVVFAVVINDQTVEISDQLLVSLEKVQQNVENDQWKKAEDKVSILRKQWEKADKWWTPFMDHREIDMLDQSVARISGFIEEQQKEDALVEIKVTKSMVERIRNREGPNIENIF